MTLVNQIINSAVTTGEPSKILRFLYYCAKEYNLNCNEFQYMNSLYFDFVIKCLDSISLLETDIFKKLVKRR